MPSKAPSLPGLDGRVPSRPRRHSVLPDHARHPVPLPCPSPISALLPVQMFPVPSLEVPTEPGCRAKHGTSPAGPRRVVFLPVQGVTCLPQHVTSAHCMTPIRSCVVSPSVSAVLMEAAPATDPTVTLRSRAADKGICAPQLTSRRSVPGDRAPMPR